LSVTDFRYDCFEEIAFANDPLQDKKFRPSGERCLKIRQAPQSTCYLHIDEVIVVIRQPLAEVEWGTFKTSG